MNFAALPPGGLLLYIFFAFVFRFATLGLNVPLVWFLISQRFNLVFRFPYIRNSAPFLLGLQR